mmetsp:Transcript_49911/g.143707  ORF Transcript_49911/g.143707 Transcript_49911/m.143707 type:complete len:246 (-) Transcript_49911:194-931(-)
MRRQSPQRRAWQAASRGCSCWARCGASTSCAAQQGPPTGDTAECTPWASAPCPAPCSVPALRPAAVPADLPDQRRSEPLSRTRGPRAAAALREAGLTNGRSRVEAGSPPSNGRSLTTSARSCRTRGRPTYKPDALQGCGPEVGTSAPGCGQAASRSGKQDRCRSASRHMPSPPRPPRPPCKSLYRSTHRARSRRYPPLWRSLRASGRASSPPCFPSRRVRSPRTPAAPSPPSRRTQPHRPRRRPR